MFKVKVKIKNEGEPEHPVKTFSFTVANEENERKKKKMEKCLQPSFFGHLPLGSQINPLGILVISQLFWLLNPPEILVASATLTF